MERDAEQSALRGVVDGQVECGARDDAADDALHPPRLLLDHEHVVRAEERDARGRHEAARRGPHPEVGVEHLRRGGSIRGHRERDGGQNCNRALSETSGHVSPPRWLTAGYTRRGWRRIGGREPVSPGRATVAGSLQTG
jgi:hypothetical protein